ncbi:MAG: DUF3501 family protein [Azospirillaceae bacterium]|nr:DUF3501 family protein [Azospirillaceae bacterium]
MAPRKTEITRDDILPRDRYLEIRDARRKAVIELKRHRRLPVGPHATFYFENYDTMWLQIHEMLRVENGGEEQIIDELRAYNPLVPKGDELVATVMIEIDDPDRRNALLSRLGGLENHFFVQIGNDTITAVPEDDVERTNADGKASSVHFVHFRFTAEQIAQFRTPEERILAGIDHPQYAHMAVIPEETRSALAEDLD